MNSKLRFQHLSGLDPLPGRSDFNQDTLLGNPSVFIQFNNSLSAFDGSFLVKRQARIHLGRNSARNQFQNLGSKIHQQFINCQIQFLFQRKRSFGPCKFQGIFNQRRILRFLRGRQDQRRIRRGIRGFILSNG